MASLIYSIENQIFNGVDDYIDTGIKLFDTNKDWVVFLDFTADETQGENPIIFDAIDGSAWYGFAVVANEQMLSGANNTKAPKFDTPILGNRHCIAIRKQASQGIYQFVVPNNEITGFTEILIDGISEKDVFIGAFQVGSSFDYPWNGTLHSCKIWFGTMTDEEFISLVNPNPTIMIGTPSRTKISHATGCEKSIVTFQSDVALQSWEARATLPGITPAHGVGLLVESGGSLEVNTAATVIVECNELTQGDQEYTITVHGHGSNGYWSDGTYENSNVLGSPISLNNASYTNGILTCETTGNTNANSMYVQLLSYLNSTLVSSLVRTEEKQNVVFDFELNTSTVNKIRLKLNGNNQDGYAEFDLSNIENGYYQISYNITELQLNLAVIQDIKMTKAVV